MPMQVTPVTHKVQTASIVTRGVNAVKSAFTTIGEGIEKVLDFVLPRNPVTKHREFRFVPVFVEKALGASLLESSCPVNKVCTDKALIAKVQAVFKKVAAQCDRKDLDYEVRVMQDDKTVNAFCAPGGKVIITTAMINALNKPIKVDPAYADVSFEDKLAAVLGHEVTHAAAGHGARSLQLGLLLTLVGRIGSFIIPRLLFRRQDSDSELNYEIKVRALETTLDIGSRLGSFFYTQHHSRCHEFEADKFGIKYAAKAGYKPEGALWLQSLLMHVHGEKADKKESAFMEFLRTHPSSEKRLEENKKTVDKIIKQGVEKAFA